jgi:hypothetical protein
VVMTIEDAEEIAWMLKRENILWVPAVLGFTCL